MELMICHPHLRDGITLSKDGMDGMHLYLMKKHLIKFVPKEPPEPHSQEDHDYINTFPEKFREVFKRGQKDN